MAKTNTHHLTDLQLDGSTQRLTWGVPAFDQDLQLNNFDPSKVGKNLRTVRYLPRVVPGKCFVFLKAAGATIEAPMRPLRPAPEQATFFLIFRSAIQ